MSGQNKDKLKIVLWLTGSYLIVEVVGGIWTGSLALLADAGHMLTDVGGLALALFAIKISARAANSSKTFGYYRAEILAALANAVVLIGISFYILFEAYQRFLNPPKVATVSMSVVAIVGLAVNLIGLYILRKNSTDSLNMKGAYFEVMSDLLTSIGVILAGGIMWTTGWYYADPIISAGIGLFILPRTWGLIHESVSILLEGTPAGLNLDDLRATLASLECLEGVHDLHAWSLTSGMNALSVHVVRKKNFSLNSVLVATHNVLQTKYSIGHITVQVEDPGFSDFESHL